jgi:hypothetical protein
MPTEHAAALGHQRLGRSPVAAGPGPQGPRLPVGRSPTNTDPSTRSPTPRFASRRAVITTAADAGTDAAVDRHARRAPGDEPHAFVAQADRTIVASMRRLRLADVRAHDRLEVLVRLQAKARGAVGAEPTGPALDDRGDHLVRAPVDECGHVVACDLGER